MFVVHTLKLGIILGTGFREQTKSVVETIQVPSSSRSTPQLDSTSVGHEQSFDCSSGTWHHRIRTET